MVIPVRTKPLWIVVRVKSTAINGAVSTLTYHRLSVNLQFHENIGRSIQTSKFVNKVIVIDVVIFVVLNSSAMKCYKYKKPPCLSNYR